MPEMKIIFPDGTPCKHKGCIYHIFRPCPGCGRTRAKGDYYASPLDPVCILHSKRLSEHDCLFCCLCFEDLTPEECNTLPNGQKEDICKPCAAREKAHLDK